MNADTSPSRIDRRRLLLAGAAWACGGAAMSLGPVRSVRAAAGPDMPASGTPVPGMEPLDQALQDFMRRIDATACTAAIGRDGKQVYCRGFGWQDAGRRVPLRADALMRVASVSKPVTAAIIQHLIRDRKLTLDDKVFKLLPIRPPAGARVDPRLADITVQNLLQHKGGWDSKEAGDPMFKMTEIRSSLHLSAPPTSVDVIRYMLGQPLQNDPGKKEAYSNFGYCVLGRVIEMKTKKPYAAALKEIITDPLKISADLKVGRGRARDRDAREVSYPVSDDVFSLDVMDAHGGLIASAPALLTFLQMYWLSGDVRRGSAKTYSFFGSLPGTTAMVLQRPDGTDVAVLLNSRHNDSYDDDNGVLRDSVLKALATGTAR